jgi:glutamine cyclotransferase
VIAAATAVAAACGDTKAPAPPDGGTAPPPATGAPAAPGGPATLGVSVVRTLPHDPTAFTQGLFIRDGQLYESTGLEGQSEIRRVDLATGAVQQRRPLDRQYFGEGIAAVGDRLYQLTWKNGRAFTYDLKTFTPGPTFSYYGEGWGLTTDGTVLYMSDGTARLRVVDPRTFQVQRTIDVTDGGSPVSQLNELEWVKGEILANVWQSEQIARIDPRTGQVTAWIDLTGILPPGDRTGKEDVLNGIAWDAASDRLYVTGKNWSRMFEVRLTPR